MRVKLIEAEPLSTPKTLDGVFYWYEDYERLKNKPKNIILGHYSQDPNLLLYANNVQGYIVKEGGFTSHLAVVGRELGIPVYRYSNLDKLVSGERIIVVPKIEEIKVPDRYVWTIRVISKDREDLFKKMSKNIYNIGEIVNIFNIFFKVNKFAILYEADKNDRTIYVKIETTDMKKLYDTAINQPNELLDIIERYEGAGIAFVCKFLVEHLTPYLMKQVGIERTLKSIHRHTAYWLQAHKNYLMIRFGIKEDSVMEYLHSLARYSKKEITRLEEPYESIAKLVAKCIEKYEAKNIKDFG